MPALDTGTGSDWILNSSSRNQNLTCCLSAKQICMIRLQTGRDISTDIRCCSHCQWNLLGIQGSSYLWKRGQMYISFQISWNWICQPFGSGLAGSPKKSLHIGSIYREHKLPFQGDMDREELLRQQRERWDRLTENWTRAAMNARCVCIGDINLDHSKCNNPEPHHSSMIRRIKTVIEIRGFIQVITDTTRFWNHQTESLLDHIWLNCLDRLVSHQNLDRSSSDHNVISLKLSQEEQVSTAYNILKRSWTI